MHEHFLDILKVQCGHTCTAPKMMMKCCSVMLPLGSYSLYIDCGQSKQNVNTGQQHRAKWTDGFALTWCGVSSSSLLHGCTIVASLTAH